MRTHAERRDSKDLLSMPPAAFAILNKSDEEITGGR